MYLHLSFIRKKLLLFVFCLISLSFLAPRDAHAATARLLTPDAVESHMPDGLYKTAAGDIILIEHSRRVKNAWRTLDGERYHFDENGSASVGWTVVGKDRLFFFRNGTMCTGWYKGSEGMWYFDPVTGKYADGFTRIKNRTYYFSNGVAHKGWLHFNGATYYFDDDYAMLQGNWDKYHEHYFLPTSGRMATGWTKIGTESYYFKKKTGLVARDSWIGERYVGDDGAWDISVRPTLTGVLRSQITSKTKSWSGSWSIYIKNLDSGEELIVNNRSMYAASLIKLFAMGAAYQQIAAGQISEGSISDTLNAMITVSDNGSFNSIISQIGISYVNDWDEKYGYTQTNEGHGLTPASNYSYSLNNDTGSNETSPRDCGLLLERIYKGTCVSKTYSKKMLDLLLAQTRREKIPAGVPSDTKVANKTGETDDYTHDAAIIWSPKATYVLVVMADTPGAGYSQTYHITELSQMVYEYVGT